MPISIAVKVSPSQQVRSLAATGLSAADIRDLTGFSQRLIDLALARSPKDKPKSRVEASGPLTAHDVARKTGMSLADAKLMVR